MNLEQQNVKHTCSIMRIQQEGPLARPVAIETSDEVIMEKPLTIFLNEQEWITLLSSGTAMEYLAVGFLYSEGILLRREDLLNYYLDSDEGKFHVQLKENPELKTRLKGKRAVTTGCGKGTVFFDVLDALTTQPIKNQYKIPFDVILQLSSAFQKRSILFQETGGVHACALCDISGIQLFHEDVGRHNALDKVVGEALIKDISVDEKWLITSGRLSSEMVIKTARYGIATLISRSAPTNLAVELATQLNMTLIGFARGNRMNIYTGRERVFIKGEE
ncbi:formate dehydrogenase accessory sulfurtransferase FdhD [Anoxynatronum sibiricum]|uniref:Sulfur carrier protein FdhD n=1 Tax=Anoxynatronum sibiricum TaxID=210623 RepID=A0ABU9VPQ4_9CLOT